MFRHDGTTKTNYTGAPWNPTTPPVVAGGTVLIGGTGGIMSGPLLGPRWLSLWPDAGLVRPWWAKQRIIASKGATSTS
jgi:hypothetical protein